MAASSKWLSVWLLVLLVRGANGEILDGGNVTIEFDRSAFSFDRDDGVSIVPINPESVSITSIADGVDLNFNDQLAISDFATGESDPQIGVTGHFNAGFSFLPDPGFVISGYRVTLYGTYDNERPGESSIDAGASYLFPLGTSTFTESYETAGAIAPALIGIYSAVAHVDFLEVAVGTELVYVRSDFVPDPACVEPDPSACPLIEIPIYEEVTQYMLQADLGSAAINLQGIRVQALSVPEPTSWVALIAASGWLVACKGRRNRD